MIQESENTITAFIKKKGDKTKIKGRIPRRAEQGKQANIHPRHKILGSKVLLGKQEKEELSYPISIKKKKNSR